MHDPDPPPAAPTGEAATHEAATEADAQRLRRDLALQAAGVGSFEWDVARGTFSSDERHAELYGLTPEQVAADPHPDFEQRVHPDDLPTVRRVVRAAVLDAAPFECEFRVVLPDGSLRWLGLRGRALAAEDGRVTRLLGVTWDRTREHTADAAVSRALESMPAAYYALDGERRFRHVNAEAERLLRRSRAELVGARWDDVFPGIADTTVGRQLLETERTGRPTTGEVLHPDPIGIWCELRVWPDGEGLSVLLLPSTERHAAEEAAKRASDQVQVLAEVGAHLAGTLDVETGVARLAELLVPVLADWCVVTLVDEQGELRDVGAQHRDPVLQPVLEAHARTRMPALGTPASYAARAVASGRAVVVPEPAVDAIAAVLLDAEAVGHLRRLDPRSIVVLPLRARGRTVGLVTLGRGHDRRSFGPEDLATASGVTERAALALDNARLYGQQQRIAEGLQRDLLTPPARSERWQVAVRYQPAAEAAQVGGDWYDAFRQPDGSTLIVIGDVVGHDVGAAAAMSQLRNLLRGIAFAAPDGPAGVLARLDAAMDGLGLATMATALVGRLDPREGGVWLRFSSAGHPSPAMVRADGSVVALAVADRREGPDLLLGIDPTTTRHDGELLLRAGDTVLLHTDGLVERRDESLDEGTARLLATLRRHAGLPLEQLCDAVLAEMLPAHHEDDVALIAVRVGRG